MQSKDFIVKNLPAVSSFTILRISIGIVYFWFGVLKFFQGLSPAEQLAMQTIHRITFGLINDHLNIIILASWECVIGVFLVAGKWVRPALLLLFLHMICTFTPFVFFPHQIFNVAPYGLSLTGQYIVKNIIIIAAGLVLWKIETHKRKFSDDVSSITTESKRSFSVIRTNEHNKKEYQVKESTVNNQFPN
ncbi:MAG: DoxX family membrane protein [Ginsengibacter sp.]